MSSQVSVTRYMYAEAYVKMHGFYIMLGEPSESDTRCNLAFLCRCFYLSTKLLTRSRIYVWTSWHWAILNLLSDLPILSVGSVHQSGIILLYKEGWKTYIVQLMSVHPHFHVELGCLQTLALSNHLIISTREWQSAICLVWLRNRCIVYGNIDFCTCCVD